MSSKEFFRFLPAVDVVLRSNFIASALKDAPRAQLVEWIRSGVERCRQEMLDGREFDAGSAETFVVEHARNSWRFEQGARQQTVINATGILLHTNLGRACLAERAIKQMVAASGYANVEMNMTNGKRNKRGERVCRLFSMLTRAEDTAIVNNCAAATMLTLQTFAKGKEVIISRGQLVEIGGGYRLPEVFAASGAIMKEIGTTNRTYLRDYETAINENTAAIIRVHRSNFFQGGFVTEPDIAELVALGQKHDIPVIDDIGSGCMQSLVDIGLEEPTVPDSVKAGADVTLFSGDKLFGGPQAGLIVGKTKWIEMLRKSPMMRALRVDKVTLAALEATVEIHLQGKASDEIPLLQMMHETREQVKQRCESVVQRLQYSADFVVQVIDTISEIGGGSVPGSQIESAAIQVHGPATEKFASALRSVSPGVLATIREDSVRMDLRTVRPAEVEQLVQCINSAFEAMEN